MDGPSIPTYHAKPRMPVVHLRSSQYPFARAPGLADSKRFPRAPKFDGARGLIAYGPEGHLEATNAFELVEP
jgi:hypothetical protein